MEAIILSEEQYKQLSHQFGSIQKIIEKISTTPEDILYDNAQFLKLMNVSKKTAQTWRDEGIITFSQISGKIYYRQQDINKMLDDFKKPAFKKVKRNG